MVFQIGFHMLVLQFQVLLVLLQFHMVLLVGLLESYFVPLYEFHITPQVFDEKVNNVALAFELMQDAGLPKPKARPEDIVNNDLKSTLRVLYNLFTKYKHLN